MSDLDRIAANYKGQSNETLIQLSKNPDDLRKEIISILIKELDSRSLNTEASKLVDYISGKSQKEENPYAELSVEEIKEMIQLRLASGEALESIRWDLKDRGITGFDLYHQEHQEKENAYKKIDQWKEEGLSKELIESELQNTYNLDEADTAETISKYKKTGKVLKISGYLLILLTLSMAAISFGGSGRISIPTIIIFVAGISMVYSGTIRSN